ncbi:protein tramtrack, alpha isoform-like [Penaeus indicus]|uniref:protein tramtrack, alpha isoform-like n=1 Tax=Penaeus indicus TaxID=29960 RepID=UPI00300D6F34
MEPGQQFCLRWNNYQSTLQHVFHKLWISGTFVDVSLVVEGHRLDCHKVVLSACSSYFENILRDHSSHPHPLILLHDLPYSAVEALVTFMYRGEVNVSQEQLAALLRVAETLKVKGLADSAAISSFTKRQLLERCIPLLEHAPPTGPLSSVSHASSPGTVTMPTPGVIHHRASRSSVSGGKTSASKAMMTTTTSASVKRPERQSTSPGPQRKRPRSEDQNSLPPTPPASQNDTSPNETSQPSPASVVAPEVCKQEAADETDGELQIDESAGQSPMESVECDTNSTGPDGNTEVDDEELQTTTPPETSDTSSQAQAPAQQHAQQTSLENLPISKERTTTLGGKSCERTYTHLDLEEGIEAVLLGRLTPAKAIAQYRIPRRTFFRRLSAVRKSRGIPSAKENAADHFLTAAAAVNDPSSQLILPVSESDSYAASFKIKSEKQLLVDGKEAKIRCKKGDGVMAPNNSYFSLLNLAASNNYDAYLNYLKLVAQQGDCTNPEEVIEAIRKGQVKDFKQTVDDNRNVATDVSEAALALVPHNVSAE